MALPQAAAPQECPLHRGTALGSGAVLLLLVFPRGPDCKQQWWTAAFLPVANQAHSGAREEVKESGSPSSGSWGRVRLHTPCLEVVHLKIKVWP